MATITHQVVIRTGLSRVYAALTTLDGLAAWWMPDVRGACQVGAALQAGSGERELVLRVMAQQPQALVHWCCEHADTSQWRGTEILFRLRERETSVVLDFTHGYWQRADDLYACCSTKWAVYLLGLKAYLETGQGLPWPEDPPLIEAC